jgi:hypothetical protein
MYVCAKFIECVCMVLAMTVWTGLDWFGLGLMRGLALNPTKIFVLCTVGIGMSNLNDITSMWYLEIWFTSSSNNQSRTYSSLKNA